MNTNLFKKKTPISVYSILVYQCEKALEAAQLLARLMTTPDKAIGDNIERIENEADEKRAQMINYVENTYITPLDRRDLYALSRTLDDITDQITDLKDYILFFDYEPEDNSKENIALIIESIESITKAMDEWNNITTSEFLALLKITERNESKSKKLFWNTLKEVTESKGAKNIIISKEFCHNLNDLAAIVCKAADRMGDLKIKSIK